MTVLIIATAVMQALLAAVSVFLWNKVSRASAGRLHQLYFMLSGIRLVLSLAFFVLGLCFLEGRQEILRFTVIVLVIYFLVLAFDTIYFYCSLNKQKRNDKQ